MMETERRESTPSKSKNATQNPPQENLDEETEKAILIKVFKQTLIPFFVAGLGQILNGLLFERAQHWWFFLYVPEAFILVPALLGLKGNIEITYASRFCTLSNSGQANKADEIFFIARFNLCLIELQSIILSFFAVLLSNAISLINCDFKLSHAMVLVISSIYTASLSSVVVGSVMIVIVIFSRRYGIDPDNIAGPLTATLSDFITLIMLIGLGSLIIHMHTRRLYILNIIVVTFLLGTTPFLAYYIATEPRTRPILRDGWFALTAAIVIECFSGLLLQSAIIVFPGIAALHPLIAGLAGNRVSVQSSRLATALHMSKYPLGTLPVNTTIWTFMNPSRLFCLRHLDSKVAFLLLITAIPYNFLFVIVVIFTAKNIDFSWIFIGAYVAVAFVQGLILFYLCQVTIYGLWWFGLDPDNNSVPILTSICDLLGIGLLYIVFLSLHRIAPSAVLYQRYRTMNVTRQCGIDF